MMAPLAGAVVALVVMAVLGAPSRPPRQPRGAVLAPARAPTPAELAAVAGRWLDRAQPARRRTRRDAQLPDALDRLASALRAGQSLGPALVSVAGPLPDPLGTELRRTAASLQHGAPIATTLAAWAAGPDSSPDVRLVAAALSLGADAGGEVARAVDRIAATLRERRELQGEVRALATQARASAGVLAVAPLGFAGLVATIEPDAIGFLVTTPVGLACLALGLGLEALGTSWMARITRRAA